VLADTNVILDWLFERKPWMDEAQPLWDARSAGCDGQAKSGWRLKPRLRVA